MDLLLSVTPANDGWAIRSESLTGSMYFTKGGQAEATARDLAERAANSGRSAEVRVFLRDGALAGRVIHPAKHAAAN